jgi:regulator of protease activity HflC (stomatin/prohibitin superfamily)
MLRRKRILAHERGFYFLNKQFVDILEPGIYWFTDLFKDEQLDIVSVKNPWLVHAELESIIKSENINKDELEVIDLKDSQRAVVWIDGRYDRILNPGIYALWKIGREVLVEVVDVKNPQFIHEKLDIIMEFETAKALLNEFIVEDNHIGLYFENGNFIGNLKPGRYAFWKGVSKVKLYNVDLRVKSSDISGQEIMTADKVSLRLNTLVNYRIVDAYKSVSMVEDSAQALYREAQLVLREVIGTRELEAILAEKDSVAKELEDRLTARMTKYGIEVSSHGIRDIILPGDMKEILNKVILAKKEAEANLICRREETAAMRNQANTAKMLESNPVLMKLKELEVLEKIASETKLNIVLGEKGLTDKIVNLL